METPGDIWQARTHWNKSDSQKEQQHDQPWIIFHDAAGGEEKNMEQWIHSFLLLFCSQLRKNEPRKSWRRRVDAEGGGRSAMMRVQVGEIVLKFICKRSLHGKDTEKIKWWIWWENLFQCGKHWQLSIKIIFPRNEQCFFQCSALHRCCSPRGTNRHKFNLNEFSARKTLSLLFLFQCCAFFSWQPVKLSQVQRQCQLSLLLAPPATLWVTKINFDFFFSLFLCLREVEQKNATSTFSNSKWKFSRHR